jgi:hypothetical protein
MKELEKRGVATVALVSDDFVHDHRRTAETMGMPELPFARIGDPLVSLPAEAIWKLIDRAIEGIIEALVTAPTAAATSSLPTVTGSWLTFEGADQLAALKNMNEQFLEWQIGDGLPLVPPTREALAAMLAGTTRDSGEVLGVFDPGLGIATVEKVAINAVLAGCLPQHLPIVIAAVECMVDHEMNLREKAISTGPAAPMIIVNGPARHLAGLNTGICMLGPGAPSRANTAIGRALRLCMMNIGMTYPAISDMDTIGSPMKYGMCLAENEERSPYGPYHVDVGLAAQDSSVTVGFVYGQVDLADYQSLTPESAISKWATGPKYMGVPSTGFWLVGHRSNPLHGNQEKEHHYLVLSVPHARMFQKAGWTKRDIQVATHREARHPFSYLSSRQEDEAIKSAHPDLSWLWDSPDALVPVLEDESCYDIIVAGSPGSNRSTFMWGMGGPHTKQILQADLQLQPKS